MMSNPVLEVQEICKIFPGVVANQDVSLSLHSGEILACLLYTSDAADE